MFVNQGTARFLANWTPVWRGVFAQEKPQRVRRGMASGKTPRRKETEEECTFKHYILRRLLHQGSGHCRNNYARRVRVFRSVRRKMFEA